MSGKRTQRIVRPTRGLVGNARPEFVYSHVELSRNTVRLLVALMTLAIGGVLYLQYRLLKNNVELKEQSFAHNVMAALDEASARLEEVDIRNRVFVSAGDSGLPLVLHMKKRAGAERPPMRATAISASTNRRATFRVRNFVSQAPRPIAVR